MKKNTSEAHAAIRLAAELLGHHLEEVRIVYRLELSCGGEYTLDSAAKSRPPQVGDEDRCIECAHAVLVTGVSIVHVYAYDKGYWREGSGRWHKPKGAGCVL